LGTTAYYANSNELFTDQLERIVFRRCFLRMNILSAPTSLGNRPYEDNGRARRTDEGPARIRDQRIVERLGARDLGNIAAADYRDFIRRPGVIRNEDLVLDHVQRIATTLQEVNGFTLILGGDCSVMLGSILGLARGRDIGLAFIDAHDDFNTIERSPTGAVAGMHLALATGRGVSQLAHLNGPAPLVRDENVVAVGIRDGNFADATIRRAETADEILEHFGDREFFIHFDVDALDPSYMPYVDSPEPGGLDPSTITQILKPLVQHPNAIGMELTIYDPRNDHDSRGAALLAQILENAFL
jgi:arginase